MRNPLKMVSWTTSEKMWIKLNLIEYWPALSNSARSNDSYVENICVRIPVHIFDVTITECSLKHMCCEWCDFVRIVRRKTCANGKRPSESFFHFWLLKTKCSLSRIVPSPIYEINVKSWKWKRIERDTIYACKFVGLSIVN